MSYNSSYEIGTLGAAAVQSATLGSTSAHQQFGAWSLSVTPNSNGTSGAILGTFTAANGADYTVSAYANLANGVAYRIAVGDSSGVNQVASSAMTGGGTWHRYSVAFTEASGANRAVVIQKTSGNSVAAFYVDGVQAEQGSLTTYIDGDQDDCIWLGQAYNSQSYRTGQTRRGGSVVPLAAIGLTPADAMGAGMPPVINTAQSYAIIDGQQFQRQRTDARSFSITSYPGGSSWGDFHITRRTIIDALKIDLIGTQMPCRFWYTGANGTQQLDAVYDSGLEFGQMSGRGFVEDVAVKFVAFDNPYWAAPTWEGTTLIPRINLGSVNYIAQRSASGLWGSVGGANGSSISGVALGASNGIRTMAYHPSGTLYVGGTFTGAGGTRAPNIAMWSRAGTAWGTLGGGATGTVNNIVTTIITTPTTRIYFGGSFTQIAGTTARRIGFWDGAFGTLVGGTLASAGGDEQVSALNYGGGTLFAGGNFETAAGTTAPAIALWNTSVWGTLTNGTLGAAQVLALTQGLDNKIYIGGIFTSAGGTSAGSIASWNGTFGTLSTGLNTSVSALTTEPNGKLLVGGLFTSAGGVSAGAIAEWNGQAFTGLGSGISPSSLVASPVVRAISVDPQTGVVYVAGLFDVAGGLSMTDALTRYTGGAWTPFDVDLSLSAFNVFAMARTPDNILYVGGAFNGTATAASIATIVNHGRAVAYPVLRLSLSSSAGTAVIRQIANTTTNSYLYFNLTMQPGESVYLTTAPGQRSLTSDYRGNLFGAIIPGSNLSSFNLLPGTNTISFFSDNDSLQAAIYWVPRGWSLDAGTTFV